MPLADAESCLDGGAVPVVLLDAVVVVVPGLGFILPGCRIRSVFPSGVRYERVRVGGIRSSCSRPIRRPFSCVPRTRPVTPRVWDHLAGRWPPMPQTTFFPIRRNLSGTGLHSVWDSVSHKRHDIVPR
ncbi:hypothetical protein BTHE_1941 [Bifidobacterium thermophilum]|nr:hypothetical protein BTHE_1941 [Bifidobacterium thermophilum]